MSERTILAVLYDTVTGRQYTYVERTDAKAEVIEFMWTEGAWSCDCIRGLLLYGRAARIEIPCGGERIELLQLVDTRTGRDLMDLEPRGGTGDDR